MQLLRTLVLGTLAIVGATSAGAAPMLKAFRLGEVELLDSPVQRSHAA